METIQPTLRVVTTPEFSSSTIASPLEGNVKELSTIEDEVFSSGMLGKGVAIEPDNGDVVSPVAGVVTTVFPTKHAIGLTSDDGVEILIHIGMDTVGLNGEAFKGDLLVRADLSKIKAAGLSIITPVVITNSDTYRKIIISHGGKISKGQEIITVKA